MKQLAMCLVPILVLVTCGVDSPSPAEDDPAVSSVEPAARTTRVDPVATESWVPSVRDPSFSFGPCAPGSQGTCTGAAFGTACGSIPPLFCLPAQTLPSGGTLCRCAAQ